jgi:formate--tetrahydrofolate ligase
VSRAQGQDILAWRFRSSILVRDEEAPEMTMPSALEISRQAPLKPIADIAEGMGIPPGMVELYGDYVAKIGLDAVEALADRPRARYVVVTAVTPTPLGEGKTTAAVGLGEAMHHIGRTATVTIRQGSMGPTFGIKGGAAGGGYSQVVPFEKLNLHLTGDMHAVTAAHNQLAAMLDNHLHQGNALGIDLRNITWRRVLDVNDRALRNIVIGLGAREDGVPRQSGFDITAASEAMAVLALSVSLRDMRQRLGKIVVGYTGAGVPVTAEQLRAAGAMTVIMRDALQPNLLQTLENTPVLVHAGPFGNIAHGNSSVLADLIGIRAGDFLITEAGFGADMGAERFFNIKCRDSGLVPDAAVVVTTVRALKAQSGNHKIVAGRPLPPALLAENPGEVHIGGANLRKQVENVLLHGVTPVVAINAMPGDFASEHAAIGEIAADMGVRCAVTTHFADGGRGAAELAEAVAEAAEQPGEFRFLYPLEAPLREKIETIATRVYGADGVDYAPSAARQLDSYERNGFGTLPVCIAKTPLSLSHDPSLRGVPTGWRLPVREVRASVGAGFIYPICGEMRTMPGLASTCAAERIDIDDDGNIVGLA